MAENKTQPTKSSVTAFLTKINDRQLRGDCFAILEMMRKVSKCEPLMWGSAIVGFGSYHYVYESGREGDTLVIGFSPRKQNISKGCLYIKSLSDVNTGVLKKIFAKSFKEGELRNAHAG